MGPPVSEGCSRAATDPETMDVGLYWTECCVKEVTDSTTSCPEPTDFASDETAHCDNHHKAIYGGAAVVELFNFGNGGTNVPRQSDCGRLNGDGGDCNSLESAGWDLSDSTNDFCTCDGATCGGGWCAGCSSSATGTYAGFWAGGGATGKISYPLPDGYDSGILKMGMHYDNPQCRGILRVGGNEM